MNNSLVRTRMRLLTVYLSIAFLFVLLLVRLVFVCIIDARALQEKANAQQNRELPLKAERGNILDANGEIIVGNKQVYTIYVRPRSVTDVNLVASVLSKALDLNEDALRLKIIEAKTGEFTLKKNVPYETGVALKNLGMNGVYFTVDSYRDYSYSSYLAQVVGYTNVDNQGQNGLEGFYDSYLKGRDGQMLILSDNKGSEIDNTYDYIPAQKGADLLTTIDINVQSFAQEAVALAVQEWKCKRASMIVMDVNDGSIVAMSSAPTYDLDNIPRSDLAMLNAYSKNIMITDVYEPGSTFKIFTTAIAIENGVVSNGKTFYCAGSRTVDGQRIKCWRSKGHGSQNLAEGVQNSCNCVFMDLALSLGTQNLYEGLRNFGFGSKTGIDFYSESKGILMDEKSVKNVDLARIGFGQAVAVTPVQLLSGVCSVVNGGYKVSPHFTTSIIDESGNRLYEFNENREKILSKETSDKMKELLYNVVAVGSGKKAGVDGYKIGGKTGTAQKYENGVIARGKYISSFVGFAPVDDPKYAILMLVDEPNSYAYYGSIVAAPYVSQVFSKIFNYEGIEPTEENIEEYVEMPMLIGKTYDEAKKELDKLGLQFEVSGDGEVVKFTLPLAGEKVRVHDVVLLDI